MREQRDGLHGVSNILERARPSRRQGVCGWPAHASAFERHHECGESGAGADRHQDVIEFFRCRRTKHALTKREASEARLSFRGESLQHVFGEPRGIDDSVLEDIFQLTRSGAGHVDAGERTVPETAVDGSRWLALCPDGDEAKHG